MQGYKAIVDGLLFSDADDFLIIGTHSFTILSGNGPLPGLAAQTFQSLFVPLQPELQLVIGQRGVVQISSQHQQLFSWGASRLQTAGKPGLCGIGEVARYWQSAGSQ